MMNEKFIKGTDKMCSGRLATTEAKLKWKPGCRPPDGGIQIRCFPFSSVLHAPHCSPIVLAQSVPPAHGNLFWKAERVPLGKTTHVRIQIGKAHSAGGSTQRCDSWPAATFHPHPLHITIRPIHHTTHEHTPSAILCVLCVQPVHKIQLSAIRFGIPVLTF